jgi:hypothetical protein
VCNADFYPASAFRDDSAPVKYAVAFFALDEEINAGTSVKLAYYNPFGSVDNKLTAPNHAGRFTEAEAGKTEFLENKGYNMMKKFIAR